MTPETQEKNHHPHWHRDHLTKYRETLWRLTPQRRLENPDHALDWLNTVGIAYAFAPSKGIFKPPDPRKPPQDFLQTNHLPTLWEAVCGKMGGIPAQRPHHDPYVGKVWHWKDQQPISKKVSYGKFLRGKPGFLSLDILPHVYRLRGDQNPKEDYLLQYANGTASAYTKKIYECVMDLGPISTGALRRETGMSGKTQKSAFDKTMEELQQCFRVVKVDIDQEKYGYLWDVFHRWMPDIIDRAAAIQPDVARRTIIHCYLKTMGAATDKMIRTLFGWNKDQITKSLNELAVSGGIILDQSIEGLNGTWIVSAQLAQL